MKLLQQWPELASVAVGGALGAVGRYLVSVGLSAWRALPFPAGTLAVNLLGSFLIGCLFAWGLSKAWRLFFITGLLGGFTTFSAFSLETLELLRQDQRLSAGAYALISVLGGLLMVFAGFSLANSGNLGDHG